MKHKIITLLFFITFLTLASVVVSAIQPTQQYAKIYMNPLYNMEMDNDVWYNYELIIDTPDGISNVVNAMITMQLWLNPTVIFDLEVNGQTCNNPQYQVHTTFANAGEGTIYFDCSNIIKGEGVYDVRIKTSKDTGASTFWIDLTYTNNPKGDIEVHGTEYKSGDNAKVWLQLIDNSGDTIENGICFTDIYTPSGGEYIEKAQMTNMNHDGIYYYNLVAPLQDGVYPAIAECFYNATDLEYTATGFTIILGTNSANTYTATYTINGVYHKVKETKVGGQSHFELVYNFSSIPIPLPNATLGFSIDWTGKWTIGTVNDDVTVSILNQTSGTWIDLPNMIPAQSGRHTISNSVDTNNQSLSDLGYISPSGDVAIKFIDSAGIYDTSNTNFQTDQILFSTHVAGVGEWVDVKGSSELHIESESNYIITNTYGNLTNETFDGYFYLHQELASKSDELKEGQEIDSPLFLGFPCDTVKELWVRNNTGVFNQTYIQYNFSTKVDSGDETCNVIYDFDLAQNTNYEVRIKLENEWKTDFLSLEEHGQLDYDNANAGCEFYKDAHGYANYTIPLTTEPIGDNFYKSCAYLKNIYYHFNETINMFPLEGEHIFTAEEMNGFEALYIHTNNLFILLSSSADSITDTWSVSSEYSVTILDPMASDYVTENLKYFSNISTSYLNFVKNVTVDTSLISSDVWNYSDRELTDFNFNVTANVNETLIAEKVWNYNGTINTNLISQFVNAVWNYTGTISSIILDAIGLNVWKQPIRNLTYYNMTDTTNTTFIAQEVWEYEPRNVSTEVNSTEIASAVWDYNGSISSNLSSQFATTIWSFTNRLLTFFDYSKQSDYVWNNSNRTLTDFNFNVSTEVNSTEIADEVWNNSNKYTYGIIIP